jgi:hypothetical protein
MEIEAMCNMTFGWLNMFLIVKYILWDVSQGVNCDIMKRMFDIIHNMIMDVFHKDIT